MNILLANPPVLLPQGGGKELYFIKAGSRWPHTIFKTRKMFSPYLPFPFFLAYTAALLEQENFSVQVIDSVALNQTPADFMSAAEKTHPDLVLIETATPTIQADLITAKKLKLALKCLVILAGPHVTVFPRQVLIQNPFIDYLLLGEYEMNSLLLIKAIQRGGDLKDIPGIAYRQNTEIRVNSSSGLIEPLEKLPFPARHLFPSNDKVNPGVYFDIINQFKPALQLHSSRGCPFRCSYCLWINVMYNSARYRPFSPQYVVDEMEAVIRNYHAREIYFDDDTFSIQRDHVEGIVKEIKSRKIKVKWSCMADAISLDEALLEKMADSGCVGIKFGVESGSPQVLRYLEKPLDLDKIRQLSRTCFKLGIRTHASFMFGLKGETENTIQETLHMLKTVPFSSIQLSYHTPFPGTPTYYRLKKESRLGDKWEDYDGRRHLQVKDDRLQQALVDAEKNATYAFLFGVVTNPRRLIRKIIYLLRFAFRGDLVLLKYYWLKISQLMKKTIHKKSVDFAILPLKPGKVE